VTLPEKKNLALLAGLSVLVGGLMLLYEDCHQAPLLTEEEGSTGQKNPIARWY
jgi:hypothetical protein